MFTKKFAAAIAAICMTAQLYGTGVISAETGTKFIDEESYIDEVTEIIYGDLDNNKVVDLTDLSYLSLHLLEERTLPYERLINADVDGTLDVSIADLARLKQYVSKDELVKDLTPKFKDVSYDFVNTLASNLLSPKKIDVSVFSKIRYDEASFTQSGLILKYTINDAYTIKASIFNDTVTSLSFFSIPDNCEVSYYSADEFFERHHDVLTLDILCEYFEDHSCLTDTFLRTFKYKRYSNDEVVFSLENGYTLKIKDQAAIRTKAQDKELNSAVLYDPFGNDLKLSAIGRNDLEEFLKPDGKEMRMENVLEIAKMGKDITMDYFNQFTNFAEDKSVLTINSRFDLSVGNTNDGSVPSFITLIDKATGNEYDAMDESVIDFLCRPMYAKHFSNFMNLFLDYTVYDEMGRKYDLSKHQDEFLEFYISLQNEDDPKKEEDIIREYIKVHEPDGYLNEERMSYFMEVRNELSNYEGDLTLQSYSNPTMDAGTNAKYLRLNDGSYIMVSSSGERNLCIPEFKDQIDKLY